MSTTYLFAITTEDTSIDLEEGIEYIFHEDIQHFSMEQDLSLNGNSSVYFS